MANLQPIDVGVPYSFGYMLWNEGKQPAVLERVRVVGVTGPIEVVDVMARQHPSGPRRQTFMSAFGFPPPDFPSNPLAIEHTVPLPTTFTESGFPYEGLQLVIGVRSTGRGIGRIRGIEVTYRLGGQRYRNSSEGHGVLCAPAAEYVHTGPRSDDCPGNLDDVGWDKKFSLVKVSPLADRVDGALAAPGSPRRGGDRGPRRARVPRRQPACVPGRRARMRHQPDTHRAPLPSRRAQRRRPIGCRVRRSRAG